MRILFGTDGSRGAAIAEQFLLSLPLSCADEVIIVTAAGPSQSEAYALLSRSHERLASRGVHASTMLRIGRAPDVVCDAAFSLAADLVVLGSRGLGTVTGALMGSVARELVRDAPVPVLVVRAHADAPRHVVLAIDGSPEARAGVELLAELALPGDARFTLLHVLPADDDGPTDGALRNALRDAHEREGLRVLAHARDILGDRVADEASTDALGLGRELFRLATQAGAELVVLAAQGQTRPHGLLGSSLADQVLGHSHCAVLIAKPRVAARRAIPVAAHAFSAN